MSHGLRSLVGCDRRRPVHPVRDATLSAIEVQARRVPASRGSTHANVWRTGTRCSGARPVNPAARSYMSDVRLGMWARRTTMWPGSVWRRVALRPGCEAPTRGAAVRDPQMSGARHASTGWTPTGPTSCAARGVERRMRRTGRLGQGGRAGMTAPGPSAGVVEASVMFPPGVGSAPFPFWFPERSPMCVARWRRPAGAARTSPRRRSGTVTDDTRRSRRVRTMRRSVRRPERQNADGDVRGSPRKPNARVVAVDGKEIHRCELRPGVVRYR